MCTPALILFGDVPVGVAVVVCLKSPIIEQQDSDLTGAVTLKWSRLGY